MKRVVPHVDSKTICLLLGAVQFRIIAAMPVLPKRKVCGMCVFRRLHCAGDYRASRGAELQIARQITLLVPPEALAEVGVPFVE